MPKKKKNQTVEVVDHWPEIFDDIDIKAVPIEYLRSIFVYFKGGKVWEIDIDRAKEKVDVFDLDEQIEDLLTEYEDEIENLDFRLDTEKVKKDIQKRTQIFMKKRR